MWAKSKVAGAVRALMGALMAALMVAASVANAGVIETEDRDEWIASVGTFDLVDFVGYPDGTPLFDQYAHLGVLFPDGNDSFRFNEGLYLDDAGAYGGLFGEVGITVAFDELQTAVALEYPGGIQFDLFRDGELVYASRDFFPEFGEDIGFAGLIGDVPFDMAIFTDRGGGSFIDNLYFSSVPAPMGIVLFVMAPLRRRRRRS
jgi:hypothetical protein